MGKRGTTEGLKTPTKKGKNSLGSSPSPKNLQPVHAKIMNLFISNVKDANESIPTVLDNEFNTPEAHLQFAQWIDTSFPATPGVDIMRDFTPGRNIARPWMLSWDPHGGKQGRCHA